MKHFLFYSLFFILLYSCAKDPGIIHYTYSIIRPQPYLPAYPGSYWIYNSGDTIKCDKKYRIHALYSYWGIDYAAVTDSVYVPYLLPNNLSVWTNGYIYGYYSLNNWYYYTGFTEDKQQLFSEKSGDIWSYHGDNHFIAWDQVMKKDTTVLINNIKYDSVIVVSSFVSPAGGGSKEVEIARKYYAKNIGLIKWQNSKQDTAVKYNYEISSYFINK